MTLLKGGVSGVHGTRWCVTSDNMWMDASCGGFMASEVHGSGAVLVRLYGWRRILGIRDQGGAWERCALTLVGLHGWRWVQGTGDANGAYEGQWWREGWRLWALSWTALWCQPPPTPCAGLRSPVLW